MENSLFGTYSALYIIIHLAVPPTPPPLSRYHHPRLLESFLVVHLPLCSCAPSVLVSVVSNWGINTYHHTLTSELYGLCILTCWKSDEESYSLIDTWSYLRYDNTFWYIYFVFLSLLNFRQYSKRKIFRFICSINYFELSSRFQG